MGLVGADGTRAAAAARGRERAQGHRPRARAHRADPALHLPRPRGRARAVAAARLLGSGEARRRLRRRRAGPADGARQRRLHPLGRRPAPGRQRAVDAGEGPRGRQAEPARWTSASSTPLPPSLDRAAEDPAIRRAGRCRCRAAAISASRWRRSTSRASTTRSTIARKSLGSALRDRWLAAYHAHIDDGTVLAGHRGHEPAGAEEPGAGLSGAGR